MKRIEKDGYVHKHPRSRGNYLCFRCWMLVANNTVHKCHKEQKEKDNEKRK